MSSKNVDMFSMLPDDILSHILSLMPIIFAVRTSILSKRWRYSWMFVTNINIDDNCVDLVVDWVLRLIKTPRLNLFRLHFRKTGPGHGGYWWIQKAVRLNVHELDLQVDAIYLHVSVFTCKTLTKLRIAGTTYSINLNEINVNLPCLKTLDLVVFDVSGVTSKLISGCPMLESLSFLATRDDKQDYIFNIPTLKRLKITWLSSVGHNHIVVLNVPNLEYLYLSGVSGSVFVMEDVSSLVKASISLISRDCSLELDFRNFPNFPNMKHFELKNCPVEIQTKILENSPQLEDLYIKKLKLQYLHWYHDPKRVPECMLTKLTTVEVSYCNGHEWEIKFLEYVLRNAEVLKTLTVTLKNLRSVQEMWVRARLLAVPRASRYCKIRFLESGYSPSTLVKWTGECVVFLFKVRNRVC